MKINNYKPTFSVILPTFNRASHIKKSIDSVLNQTFTDFELIIVDDGSSDNTSNIVKLISDSRVKYLQLPYNQGAAQARNHGIYHSKGEYIAFQDSDDIWHKDKLREQISELNKNENCVSVCSYSHFKNNVEKKVIHCFKKLNGVQVRDMLFKGFSIGTVTIALKKKILLEAGLFDISLKRRQDFDLCIRLSLFSDFIFTEKNLIDVYHSDDSISNDSEAFCSATEIIIKKYKTICDCKNILAKQYFKIGRNFYNTRKFHDAKKYFKKSLCCKFSVKSLCFLSYCHVLDGLS